MSIASDLGLKVGSKIKVKDPDKCTDRFYQEGHILELSKDDGSSRPFFHNLITGDTTCCFTLIGRDDGITWEHYKEDKSRDKIKFPCCVPTSEIKDEATLKALVDLFEANGVRVFDGIYSDGSIEFGRVDNWKYFGVSEQEVGDFRTDFYDVEDDYSGDADTPVRTAVYSVAELLGKAKEEVNVETPWIEWDGSSEAPVPKGTKVDIKYHDGSIAIGIGSQDGSAVEGCDYTCSNWYCNVETPAQCSVVAYRLHVPSVASQEAIAERLEDSLSVGIDLAEEGSEKTVGAYEYEVGNLVKITACEHGHEFDIGEVVRLTRKESHNSWKAEKLDGSAMWYIEPDEVTLSKSLIGDVELTQLKQEPLVSITQEVKYTVVIKGNTFTFTQEELDELSDELGVHRS